MRCPEVKLNSISSSNFFTSLRNTPPHRQIKILLIALAAIGSVAFGLYRYFASPKKPNDTPPSTSPNTSSILPPASASPIEVRAPNTDFLQTILNHGEQFANSASRALIVEHEEVKYCLWWNQSHKAMNIQTHQDFLLESSNNKLGIKNCGEGRFSYLYNNSSIQGVPVSFPDEIFGLFAGKLEVLDQLERNKNVFDTATLRIMFNAIQGKPQHITVKNSHGAPLREAVPLILPLGQVNYAMWMTQMESPASNTARHLIRDITSEEPSASKSFVINIQKLNDYALRKQTNKLGLKLNSEGTIESCKINNQLIEAIDQYLFNSNADWNKTLTGVMNEFLKTSAVSTTPSGALTVHPLAITQIPEHVLHTIQWSHLLVKFLNDDFTPQDGIDADGLTRDLLTWLSQNLLDGSRSRVIQIEPSTQLPELKDIFNSQQPPALKNLGKLFAYCMTHTQKRAVTGRVLPDSFFTLLKEMCTIASATPPTNDQTLEAFGKIKKTTENGWLFDYVKDPDTLLTDNQKYILSADCLDLQNPDQVKEYIVETWKPRVNAAWMVYKGLTPTLLQTVRSLSAIDLSAQIQGNPFNRQEIAGKITTTSTEPVIQEKTQWLKELVLTEDEEWVKQLLKYVTGNSVVTATTKIKIKPHDLPAAVLPKSHTCFNELDIPITHSTIGTDDKTITDKKTLFKKNLTYAMPQTAYDCT